MKVEGQKYLFGNFFEKMTIEEKKDGIVCRVQPSISGKLVTGKDISGNFKEDFNNSKDDYERVLKLIKYFLRYNKITMLRENKYDYRVKNRNSIEVIGNRNLVLSINSNPYEQEMLKVIKDKCLYDLENILFDTLDKENVVSISFYKTDYYSRMHVFDNGYFDQDFDYINVPEEKCIIVDYTKMMNQGIKKIIIKLITKLLEEKKIDCSYCINGNSHIRFGKLHFSLMDQEIAKEIQDMIYEYNDNLCTSKQKELKLEYGKRR